MFPEAAVAVASKSVYNAGGENDSDDHVSENDLRLLLLLLRVRRLLALPLLFLLLTRHHNNCLVRRRLQRQSLASATAPAATWASPFVAVTPVGHDCS